MPGSDNKPTRDTSAQVAKFRTLDRNPNPIAQDEAIMDATPQWFQRQVPLPRTNEGNPIVDTTYTRSDLVKELLARAFAKDFAYKLGFK